MVNDSNRPTFRECFENGLNFMDEKVPGWWTKINRATFEINSSQYCIWGQLYGDFHKGLEIFHMTNYEAARFGFVSFGFSEDARFNFMLVKGLWGRLIEERQDEASRALA